jgi:hypothetical protein
MSLFNFTKSISTIAGTLGLVAIGNLLSIDSANAFSVDFKNGGFEQSIAGSQNHWNTIGDVDTTGTIDGISPTNLINQAIITTGYRQGNYADPIGNRNDDSGYNFNQSNVDPVSADTNSNADLLQGHLSLNTNAFSIDRVGGIPGIGPRTSKEGSGMYQEFTVNVTAQDVLDGKNQFKVKFDWSYLTNDGSTSFGGEQDFGFWSLGQVNGSNYTTAFSGTGNPNDQIQVLKSSSGSINAVEGDNDYQQTFDYATNNRYSYLVSGLTAGTYTYRVGFGVVDVDGLDRTSALMLDDIQIVPFEFTPSTGIAIVFSLVGVNKLRGKFNKN